MTSSPPQRWLVPSVLFVFSFLFLGWFSRYGFNIADEGFPLNGGIRVLRGDLPWRDFQSYPPGRFFLYAAIYKIFGTSILAVRWVLSFMTAGTILMIYLAGQKIMPRRFALLAAVLFLVAPGVYYGRYIAFFGAATILLFARFVEGKRHALFWLGLVEGICCLFRHDIGILFMGLAGLVVTLHNWHAGRLKDTFKHAMEFLLGAAVTVVPVVAYLLWKGNLIKFIAFNLRVAFGGYQKVALPFPTLSWATLDEWLVFYVPPLTYLMAFVVLLRRFLAKRLTAENFRIVYILALGGVTFNQAVWRTQPENVLKIIVPALLLYAWLSSLAFQKFKLQGVRSGMALLILILPVLYAHSMLTTYGWYLGSVGINDQKYERLNVPRAQILAPVPVGEVYTEMVRYIQANTQKEDPIYVTPFVGNPVYFLAERHNPSYFEWFLPSDVFMFPGVEQMIKNSLERSGTDLIVYYEFALDFKEERRLSHYGPEFYGYLFERFYLDRTVGNYWMLRRGKNNMAAQQAVIQAPTPPIQSAFSVGQTFVAQKNGLNEIRVRLVVLDPEKEGELVLRVREKDAKGKEIAMVSAKVTRPAIHEWPAFRFPEIADSAGKAYYFSVESPEKPGGSPLQLWFHSEDRYSEGSLFVNHLPLNGDLTFLALTKREKN